ncbi:MAG: hypothetical protein HFH56_13705 [Lachnospiraceae bacterium]|nr:hypothetical protein [Lachnospiraceae bacterium]MCI9472227.1 hypothetical protein [Lachnospiraceae bacterium]
MRSGLSADGNVSGQIKTGDIMLYG